MTEYVDEIRLRKHVEALASDIGERNVSKPESLAAASSYIEAEWRTQGYDVARQVEMARGRPVQVRPAGAATMSCRCNNAG